MCLSCGWPLALLLYSFHWWFHKSDLFSHHLNLKHSLLWCHHFSFTFCTYRTRWYSVIKHLKNKLQLSKPQNNSITRMPICWRRKELMCFALNHSFICICWNYNLINRRNLCACHYYTYMEGEKNNSWGPSPLTRTAEQWLSALLCGNGKPLRAVGGVCIRGGGGSHSLGALVERRLQGCDSAMSLFLVARNAPPSKRMMIQLEWLHISPPLTFENSYLVPVFFDSIP